MNSSSSCFLNVFKTRLLLPASLRAGVVSTTLSVVALATASMLCVPADAALVGLWQFESGTVTATDSSSFGNNGTFQSGATTTGTTTPGAFSANSLKLSSTSQYVLVPDSNSLDITNSTGLTIAAWVYRNNNIALNASVLAKNPSGAAATSQAGNYEFRASPTASPSFLFQSDTTNTRSLSGTSNLQTSKWTHVAVTVANSISGSATVATFYVNGTMTSTGTSGAGQLFGQVNNNPLYIGTRADFFTTWLGFLDDVAVFNEVLTQSQIQTISTGDFTAFGVPEPSTWVMGAAGIACFCLGAWPRRRARHLEPSGSVSNGTAAPKQPGEITLSGEAVV